MAIPKQQIGIIKKVIANKIFIFVQKSSFIATFKIIKIGKVKGRAIIEIIDDEPLSIDKLPHNASKKNNDKLPQASNKENCQSLKISL